MGKAVRGDKETHVRCFSVCPWPYASVLVEQVETWEPVGVPPGLVSFASASCPQREANKVGSTLSPITWLQGEHPAGSAQVDGKQRGCLHLCQARVPWVRDTACPLRILFWIFGQKLVHPQGRWMELFFIGIQFCQRWK
jgi:hypothetical protein